ncbi:MAG: hypothetical protein FWE36_07990 [Erysipelotrichales bacterium]|nr:hypothetical protein [Erysipelotrichales bacterium]
MVNYDYNEDSRKKKRILISINILLYIIVLVLLVRTFHHLVMVSLYDIEQENRDIEGVMIFVLIIVAISMTSKICSSNLKDYIRISKNEMSFYKRGFLLERETKNLKEYLIIKQEARFFEIELIFSDNQSIRVFTKKLEEYIKKLDLIIQDNLQN